MGKAMDFRTRMKYVRGIKTATRETNYDAVTFLTLVLLIGFPVGLIATRETPAAVLGAALLPLPVLYYLTIYRWQGENRREMMSFGPSAKLTVAEGMVSIDDGKNRARMEIEDIRELGVYIPGKGGTDPWWIVALKGLEYLIPRNAEGLESFLGPFREDPVFDTYPLDRPDPKPGRWTIWEKEGAG